MGPLSKFEMAEVRAFDDLPGALTYPAITPILFDEIMKGGAWDD